jgi:hypothetical protein
MAEGGFEDAAERGECEQPLLGFSGWLIELPSNASVCVCVCVLAVGCGLGITIRLDCKYFKRDE